MLYNKPNYYLLSHSMGSQAKREARRIWTRRRRSVAADLVWIAAWLVLAVAVLMTVPAARRVHLGACTTNVVSDLDN